MNAELASRNELDSIVVNVELTLSSIVQGVALSFLADSARSVLANGPAAAWAYVLAGLLIILLFWSRSLIHTLTLIRWPLEFGHNCFYIGCALVEVLAFTRLTDPFEWFVFIAIFSAVVWLVFVYDLKMIRLRSADSRSESGCALYALVRRDQSINIRFVVPAVFIFNLVAALAIWFNPARFLQRGGHVFFIVCEVAGLFVYLLCMIRAFIKMGPLIAATRRDWRSGVPAATQ